ncbi:Modification methylase DpnIIB [termite gut metagenome]|uniref:Modification methylase DpnIIB n=1 Tax=termite gut metagenome TaxID=433724 RepID=A0A5J4RVD4_9ZZZZ
MDQTTILNNIYNTDCRSGLKELPSECVDCCITSPSYYGFRDYGTAKWEGGDPNCQHSIREEAGFEKWKQSTNRGNAKNLPKGVCLKCGAIRIDNQIGLEDTPEAYIEQLVEVFTEVYRILKPTGTLWINIGDSYWGGKGYSGSSAGIYQYERRKRNESINRECSNFGGKGTIRSTDKKHEYIKRKDLIGIPWMLAFALRNAGWYLRQDIIWHKPNPMPESVKDRCTKSHEYLFLLSKSDKYYFNNEAIMEIASYDGRKDTRTKGSHKYSQQGITGLNPQAFAARSHERWIMNDGKYMRNKRSVWTVCTKPLRENHFASFPESLIKDCVLAGCPQGGIVLDPFMGSGTTAIVVRKLGCNYVGFELNPDYVAICEKRIRNELGIFK